MTALNFLDPTAHADLRVDTRNAADRHFVQIVADEVIEAAIDYPVLFTKNAESGAFYLGAMMGLESGINLVAADGALRGYRPADLVRQGFFIVEDKIAIDPDNKVFAADGAALFDNLGEPTPALQNIMHAMRVLQKGLAETEAIIAKFIALRLIEPMDITLDFDDGKTLHLEGLYSISLDALHALPDATVLALFRAGELQIAYAQAASVRNIRRLAKRRNDQLGAAKL